MSRLEQTILNGIENAISEHEEMFKEWWNDDFPCDLYYENEEELDNFDNDEYDTVVSDWVQEYITSMMDVVCNVLGIDLYNIESTYHQIIVEEIYEIVKDKMRERIARK